VTQAEKIALVRLALQALDRDDPNVDLAKGALRDVVGDPVLTEKHEASNARAESFSEFAKRTGYSTKHVRTLARKKLISTIGQGRAARVLVNESVEMLRNGSREASKHEDPIEEQGAADMRTRSRLRLVEGGSSS
jgi:hypothetical protein